jgi:hypothetical protein
MFPTKIIIYYISMNIKGMEKAAHARVKEAKYVQVCPKCGSVDLEIDFSNPVVWDYGTRSLYKCRDCGNMGAVFPEVDTADLELFRKEISQLPSREGKEETIDAKTGLFAVETEILGSCGILGAILLLVGVAGLGISYKYAIAGIVGALFLAIIYYIMKKR